MIKSLITIPQADHIIERNLIKPPLMSIPLEDVSGQVLRELIKSDRDYPAFNKSFMDGIAIKYASFKEGNRAFKIIGTQSAGKEALTLKGKNTCTEIMTGAVLTKGCDTVIPIEDIMIEKNMATIKSNVKIKRFQFILNKGSEQKKNAILINQGCVIRSNHISILAAVGKSKVKVSKALNVAMISNGNELVPVNKQIKAYQSRLSNAYFVKSALDNTQLFRTKMFHLRDNLKTMKSKLAKIIDDYDVLILSGGVSTGKFDLVPKALVELHVKGLFHKIQQKPGKPFWFGISRAQKPIFALPGNPISTQICTYRYVLPHLMRSMGVRSLKYEYAVLNSNFRINAKWPFFLLAKVRNDKNGTLLAKPVKSKGSGDFASAGVSDGFLEITSTRDIVKAGSTHQFYRW